MGSSCTSVGQRRDPAGEQLGRGAQQHRALARDRLDRLVPPLGREPVLDRADRVGPGRDRRGDRCVQAPPLVVAALLAQALGEELAQQRVVAEGAGAVDVAEQHAGALDPAAEVGGEVEGGGHPGVTTSATLESIAASRSSGSRESRSSSDRYARTSGAEPRASSEPPPPPSPCRSTSPAASAIPSGQPSVALMSSSIRSAGGSASEPRLSSAHALLGVEGEIGGGQVGDRSGDPGLRDAEAERAPARHRDAQRRRRRPDQLRQNLERVGGAVEVLGVVDHHHQRLDQQPRQLADQLTRCRQRVDAFLTPGNSVPHGVRGAGGGVGDRVDDPHHQHPGRPVGVGAADPGRAAVSLGERLLEERGLAEPGARGEHDGSRLDGIGQPLDESRSRNPPPAPARSPSIISGLHPVHRA